MRGYKSVLIVDDDPDVRESVSDALSLGGHHAVLTSDGLDGLTALERCDPPTLVLLDHTMPRMDGPAFLKELDRLESPSNVHVVMISAQRLPRPESPLVIGELPKPFDIEALLALLSSRPGSD